MSKFSEKQKSMAALVAVAAGYTLLQVGARLLDEGFGNFTQIYLRIGLAFLASCIVFRKSIRISRLKTIPMGDILILLLVGIVGYALGVYFITVGALSTNLLNVSVVYSTIPFIVYIYSMFVFKKKFKLSLFALIGVSLVGVAMIASKSYVPELSAFGKGELYVLLSVLAFGWFSVGRRMLSDHLNDSEVTVCTMFVAGISAFVLAMFAGESLNFAAFTNPNVLLGLTIGVGFNVMSTCFESYAYKRLDLVVASQISLSENLFSALFGVVFYGEFVTVPEIVGAVLIVAAVWVSNRITDKE
jgi:drug/metabolite transporter (DMT)-like permease